MGGIPMHLDYFDGSMFEAVERIARTIRRSRAGLQDENRPIGVFLFVGPTGVGKTLLAKEVSKWLFDEHRGLIRIDMSEYAEKHNVARLIGPPPRICRLWRGRAAHRGGTPPTLRRRAAR